MAVHGYKVVLTVIADSRTVTRWRGTGVSSRQTIRAWMARSVGGGLEGLINPHQFLASPSEGRCKLLSDWEHQGFGIARRVGHYGDDDPFVR